MALTISRPELLVDDAAVDAMAAEQAITLRCSEVAWPDGSAVGPEDAETFGFFIYRTFADHREEVWNDADKRWQADRPAPHPLAHQNGVWQMIIAPMGQHDQAGQPVFATQPASGYPRYSVRCLFKAKDATGTVHETLSAASTSVRIYPSGALNRAGLAMTPKEAAKAEEVRLYLKDAGLTQERGVIAIRQDGAGFAIEIEVSQARLRLTKEGDVIVSPRGGREARIEGDLVVHGALAVQQTLTVAGKTELNGGVIASGAVAVTGSVAVAGTLTVNGRSVLTV